MRSPAEPAKWVGVVVFLTALAIFISSTLFAKEVAPVNHIIVIQGMAFVPQTLHLVSGDSVTWINRDILMHGAKATAQGDVWQSKDLLPKESWTKTFTRGGTYVCPYHPTMTGELIID